MKPTPKPRRAKPAPDEHTLLCAFRDSIMDAAFGRGTGLHTLAEAIEEVNGLRRTAESNHAEIKLLGDKVERLRTELVTARQEMREARAGSMNLTP